MLYEFEYDVEKSAANQEKHGIDFEAAKEIWNDECRLEIPAISRGESRYAVIGRLNGKLWIAFVTYRRSVIRIISVRRARRKEAELYEYQK